MVNFKVFWNIIELEVIGLLEFGDIIHEDLRIESKFSHRKLNERFSGSHLIHLIFFN